jgi:hypothetical protein
MQRNMSIEDKQPVNLILAALQAQFFSYHLYDIYPALKEGHFLLETMFQILLIGVEMGLVFSNVYCLRLMILLCARMKNM